LQDLDELFHQMEKAADKLFDRAWLQHLSHAHWEPQVNVYECANRYTVLVDLPGVPRENIAIQINEDRLIISGIKSDPRPQGALRCLHLEIPQGRFRKEMRIGSPIQVKSIKANLKGGVLEITVPKEPSWS